MCLDLRATLAPDDKGSVGAKGLSRESGLHVVKIPGTTAFEFQLVPGGCCCTMLAKDARDGTPFVKIDEAALPGLERALKLLGDQAGRFSFSARWLLDPDELLPSVRIPLKNLLRRVRENRIENGRKYVVGKPA